MSRYQSAPDLTHKQPTGGGGMAVTFLCPLCGKKKGSSGRTLKRVMGLRTWVCAGCKEGK